MKQPVLPRQQAWDSIISAGAACSLPVLCFWRQQNQASAVAAASSNTTIGATIAATEPPLEGVLLLSGGAAVAFLEVAVAIAVGTTKNDFKNRTCTTILVSS